MFPGQGYDLKCCHGFLGNLIDLLTHSAAEKFDKVCDERRDVFLPCAKRRYSNREDIQAIVQIGTKLLLSKHLREVTVGGGNEANIHLVRTAASQALELLFLQDTQQLRLQCWRNVAHFVEKQGAVMGHFEAANLLGDRAGKRAFFVAEEFTLEKIERNGRAIQFDEWPSVAWAQVVNRARNQLLASPGFSFDQYCGRGRRYSLDLFKHGFQRGTVTDDLLEPALASCVRPSLKLTGVATQPPAGRRSFQPESTFR